MHETPTILITSADVKKIAHERSLVTSEIALKEAKLRELFHRRTEMNERLAQVHELLAMVGPDTLHRRTSH